MQRRFSFAPTTTTLCDSRQQHNNNRCSLQQQPLFLVSLQAFSIHKTLGTYGKFIIPVHVGAAAMHLAKGQAIFYRIGIGAAPVVAAAAASEATPEA